MWNKAYYWSLVLAVIRRHNFAGESVFFQWKSVSMRILHRCINVSRHFSRNSYNDAVCKISRRNKIDSQRQRVSLKGTESWFSWNRSFTSRDATVGLRLAPPPRETKSPVFRKFSRKANCIDDRTFVYLHIPNNLFFINLPQISITTWYGCIISKSPKSVLDMDNPYQVACLGNAVSEWYYTVFHTVFQSLTPIKICWIQF